MATVSKEAELLWKMLCFANREGTITEQKPIKGREIAARYNAKFNDNVTDATVREWVNELCRNGFPVFSTSETPAGYAKAVTVSGLQRTIAQRKSRVRAQVQAIEGLEYALGEMVNAQLRNTKTGEALSKQFELEPMKEAV